MLVYIRVIPGKMRYATMFNKHEQYKIFKRILRQDNLHKT